MEQTHVPKRTNLITDATCETSVPISIQRCFIEWYPALYELYSSRISRIDARAWAKMFDVSDLP